MLAGITHCSFLPHPAVARDDDPLNRKDVRVALGDALDLIPTIDARAGVGGRRTPPDQREPMVAALEISALAFVGVLQAELELGTHVVDVILSGGVQRLTFATHEGHASSNKHYESTH